MKYGIFSSVIAGFALTVASLTGQAQDSTSVRTHTDTKPKKKTFDAVFSPSEFQNRPKQPGNPIVFRIYQQATGGCRIATDDSRGQTVEQFKKSTVSQNGEYYTNLVKMVEQVDQTDYQKKEFYKPNNIAMYLAKLKACN